ncbi:MAG: flagellar M-ring protein FliF [Deltaproteobacteria bacterium]|nr:flagellar M-ring protein FliF [Deltaproteobacteria bacterium]
MATTLDPSAILSEMIAGYMRLPLAQKILFPLLFIGSISGIVLVSQWASRPDYAVLYSDLKPADAGAVIEALKTQKVKYEVRGAGDTIAVSPPELVHELRIALASEGVPKGGVVGLEIFDNLNLGATNFVEKRNFQRAIQGELERTIASIEAVTAARVHITIPEKSVFSKKGDMPTASVMLRLRPGAELGPKQIKGISNLVAGSVEGLQAENVTIIDVLGNLLTSQDEEGEDSLTAEATRLQYQREVERGYAQQIEHMLAKVLGAGKVTARVSASMDFSMNEREEESYDPGGQVMRSERSIEEGVGTTQRGGVPGVVANLTNDPNLLSPPAANAENASRKEQVKNYEVSRAVTRISSPRGKLTRLAVAVLVDGTYETVAAAEGAAAPQKVFKPLDGEVMSQIESLVKAAVGFDSSRGDTITVENIPFYLTDSSEAKALESEAFHNTIFKYLGYVGPIMFVLLFFMFAVRPVVKFLVTPTEAEVDLTRLLPTGIAELEQELESERTKAQVPEFVPAVDLEQLEEMMAENSRIVKENPHQAALLIRYWLNDGRL